MAVADWIRFQQVYGFGSVRAAKALEKWHSPTLLFHTEERLLRQHGMKEEECRRITEAAKTDVSPILSFCEKNKVRILTPEDDLYPDRLRHIYSPPVVLYVAGNWENIDEIPPLHRIRQQNGPADLRRSCRPRGHYRQRFGQGDRFLLPRRDGAGRRTDHSGAGLRDRRDLPGGQPRVKA